MMPEDDHMEIQSPDNIITVTVEFTLKNGSQRYIDCTLREITKYGQSDRKMDTTIEFASKNWSRTYIICPILNKSKHISQLGHRLHIQHKLARYNRPQQHSGKARLPGGGYWFREPGSIPSQCNFCVDSQNHKESTQSVRSPHGVRVSPCSPRGLHQDTWGSVKYCKKQLGEMCCSEQSGNSGVLHGIFWVLDRATESSVESPTLNSILEFESHSQIM